MSSGVASVQILGASGTTGSVDVAGLGFSAPFSIAAEGVATVVLPASAVLSTGDGVEDVGVRVSADTPVVVYGLHLEPSSADTYLALPVPALGTAYDVLTYGPQVPFTSQLAVVATVDGTQLTVTPTATIGAHPPGMEFVVALDAGQVYQGQSSGDLTGTRVVADHPIAVFSGNPWVNVPAGVGFADHLAEQLPPTAAWGTDVFLVPSALRAVPERLRIQVSQPNTLVLMSPGGPVTLGPGGSVETSFDTPVRLQSTQPFSASHFAAGGSLDDGAGDPFLLVPLPVERFASCYRFATADDGTLFPHNFVNLVVPSASVDAVRLDGAALAAGDFSAIGASGFSYAQLAVAPGPHRLDAPLAFGTSVYGFGSYVSYASPAGGASEPFGAGFTDCPEPGSASLAIAAVATAASLSARSRRPQRPLA